MNKDLEKQLVEAYPELFVEYGGDPRKTCMSRGCEHGDGWFNLLKSLCAQIQHYASNIDATNKPVRFLQVKEKFGTLRIYHDGDEQIEKIVEFYSEQSAKTCETCGSPGEVTQIGGWWLCRCPECLTAELERRKPATDGD